MITPGLSVATIRDNKVDKRRVSVRRDFGTEIEIAEGVVPGDRIVLNPPSSILPGQAVNSQEEASP